jgi:vitamin B12 transporter
MRSIHVFSLLLTSGLASAQTPDITGTVLDASGRPVGGATVACGDSTGATDDQGVFVIRGVPQCTAKITREGFTTQSLALEAGHAARITLDVAELRERITVSALRTETTPEEAGVAVTVFSSTDLAQRHYPELATILREVPGLQVVQTGRHGGTASVFTRGAPSDGTLVLLDGMPLNDPGGAFNFSTILASDVDRIEVIRGPESALFGASASGGVIQLFSRHGDPERRTPHISLSYDRGTFQTDHWTSRINGGLADRFDYSLNAEQYHTVSEFPNDFYRNTTGAMNLGYRLTRQTQIRGIFRAYDSTVGSPNRTGYGLFDFDARRRDRDYAALLRVDDVRNSHFVQRFTVGYHKLRDTFVDNITDGPYKVTALVHDDGNRVYLDGLIDPRFPPVLAPGYRLVSRTVTNFAGPFLGITGRTDADYQGTLTHTGGSLIFGYEFEREHGLISNSDVNRDNHGVFVHKQQTIASRIYLSGGVRMEQNTVFHTKLTARGAASVKLIRSTFLRFSAARGITEPSLLQSFARDSTFVGNPNLRLEKSASYEMGVVSEWLHRRIRTEVSAFRNTYRDLIVFVSPPFPALGTWGNVDAAWARGFEFTTQTKLTRLIAVNAGVMKMWSRVTASSIPFSLSTGVGQELARRPGNSGNVSVALTPKRWYLQAGATFVGERQETSDTFGATRNPGYQFVWASGSFRLTKHVSPFFRAENLANERYQEVLGYSSLSRNFRAGARIEW